ncbi:hypothetical protein [Litoribacillus peritrichatus]|uniref:LPS assembly lipoprotein LptE n=1 Tax=Litoribacillus peritrichatus TaxID=718191 RepID=A0ABP7NAW3_9GAMM
MTVVNMQLPSILSVFALSLLLSACGWQLRGYNTGSVPIDEISINVENINNPAFVKVFRETLANEYNIAVVENAEITASVLRVSESKRASSKDRNGDVSEYEHTIVLTLSTLTQEDKKPLQQNFTNIRRQSYNENNLLSSDIQEVNAKREMYQELTRQYASYLSRQLPARPKAEEK